MLQLKMIQFELSENTIHYIFNSVIVTILA